MMPLKKNNTNLARILHNSVMSSPSNQVSIFSLKKVQQILIMCLSSLQARYHVWLQMPMVSREYEAAQYQRNGESTSSDDGESCGDETWHWWSRFRCLANFEKKLGLALELTANLPDSSSVDRWLGEPVKCLVVSTDLFIRNKKGYPVLSKPHQSIIKKFLTQKVQIMISGSMQHQEYRSYQQYMDHLWQVLNV